MADVPSEQLDMTPPLPRTGRVAFYLHHRFHAAMLDPVQTLVDERVDTIRSGDRGTIVEFAPDVLVIADGGVCDLFRDDLPHTLIVFVRHGFASKHLHQVYAREPDFVCVTSAWVRDDFARVGLHPRYQFWVTGFPPVDAMLAARHEGRRPSAVPLPDGLVDGQPTLLYTPTHNPLLNSVEVLGDDWVDRLRRDLPDLNVIIKPHPVLPERDPDLLERWCAMAARNGRVHIVDSHEDVYPWMPLADVLLTDASSTMFFFLALDRPIVAVVNPRRFEDDASFDPEGQEWTWRDLAADVSAVDELGTAVGHALAHPDELADRRAARAGQLFGEMADGRASERIAGRILELVDDAEPGRWIDAVWGAQSTIADHRAETAALRTEVAMLQTSNDGERSARAAVEADNAALRARTVDLEAAVATATDQADRHADADRQLAELRKTLPVRASARIDRLPFVKTIGRRLFRRTP